MPETGSPDWFGACRQAAARIAGELARMPSAERRERVGQGAGGDATIRIDRVAEEILVHELTAVGVGFRLVSEELGEMAVNGGGTSVVIVDPIDGSLNAGRGLTPFSVSVAVADGPRMGDVRLGFVHDFGTGEEFTAARSVGAFVDGARVAGPWASDRLELVLVEGALPRRVARAGAAFDGSVGRLRAVGSLALSLCYVGAGRGDAMVGLGPGRPVDVAAGQLFAREAGLVVGMPRPADLPGAVLDVSSSRTIAAARDAATLELMLAALAPEDVVGP
jgi:myo-inositol-1(or 4)-monophosphatase